MKMNITKESISKYADKYDKNYKEKNERVEETMKKTLERRRWLTRKELIKIGVWKSPRAKPHYESNENDDSTVKEVTRISFVTTTEKVRIKILMALDGVSWGVASTILHFAFPNKYPIMDFRVIRSLGWQQPSAYSFNFWQRYCKKINTISKKYNLSIRTVEKAFWRYDKEEG
jgi:hypothetical protein